VLDGRGNEGLVVVQLRIQHLKHGLLLLVRLIDTISFFIEGFAHLKGVDHLIDIGGVAGHGLLIRLGAGVQVGLEDRKLRFPLCRAVGATLKHE
jgi:hypothetical protein